MNSDLSFVLSNIFYYTFVTSVGGAIMLYLCFGGKEVLPVYRRRGSGVPVALPAEPQWVHETAGFGNKVETFSTFAATV